MVIWMKIFKESLIATNLSTLKSISDRNMSRSSGSSFCSNVAVAVTSRGKSSRISSCWRLSVSQSGLSDRGRIKESQETVPKPTYDSLRDGSARNKHRPNNIADLRMFREGTWLHSLNSFVKAFKVSQEPKSRESKSVTFSISIIEPSAGSASEDIWIGGSIWSVRQDCVLDDLFILSRKRSTPPMWKSHR